MMQTRQDDVELANLNRKMIQESQVYLGASGEWYHVIFKNSETAVACAKQVHADGAVLAQPKVHPKDPQVHARYPDGIYFFRVHNTAFDKFKSTYGVTKEVDIYREVAPSVKEEKNSCTIS